MKHLSLHLQKSQSHRKAQTLHHHPPGGWRAYAAAMLTVILWASAFPGIRAALPHYTPFHVALLRYATASIVLAVYALFTHMRLPHWRDLPRFAALGLVGIAYYNVALNGGEIRVPSAEASFLVASAPIFMAAEALFLLKERVRLWGWIGIAVSCAGITLITVSQTTGFRVDAWALLVLSAAVAQSLYSIPLFSHRGRNLFRNLSRSIRLCKLGVCTFTACRVNSWQFSLSGAAGRYWHRVALAWRASFIVVPLGRSPCSRRSHSREHT